MTVVKGSKQYPLKVVEERPTGRWLIFVGFVGVSIAGVIGSYFIGYAKGTSGQEQAARDVARLEQELDESVKQVVELQQSFANIELGAEVDRKANEEVRQEVIELKKQLTTLEEENGFYKGLMAPSENRKGLTIGSVEILDTANPREFRYKVVMKQLATNHTLLKGDLRFNIFGRLADQDVEYAISQISDQYVNESIRLRFKYFQTIAGDLTPSRWL